jgi:hypothetical protein
MAKVEPPQHLHHLLPHDATKRRVGNDNVEHGWVLLSVVSQRDDVGIVVKAQQSVLISDVRVPVVVQHHVGHRNPDHAVRLLDPVQVEELELV